MPTVNFQGTPWPSDIPRDDTSPLQPGKYRVFCKKCEPTFNEQGIEVWKLTLEVIEGPRAGRWVWDNMAWGSRKSEKSNLQALARCKLICHRLGGLRVDEMQEIDVRPEDLVGKTAIIDVEVQQQDWKTKEMLPPEKWRNSVAFDGYDFDNLPQDTTAVGDLNGDDIPF